ncbi:MAG: hypothetical protein HGA80_02665 [Candidatus Omnitrophica bacterium]|nr:hypothetical protein [Candidatus Omnitrophota bacterium]
MKRNRVARTVLSAVVVGMYILSASASADTVILKNGNLITGEVTDKNANYLSIITADSQGVKTYYLADKVDKVNGETYGHFRMQKNRLVSRKFVAARGKKHPVVSLVLKDGRTVKGELLDRNEQYFRIMLDGTDRTEEFLLENIAKAE